MECDNWCSESQKHTLIHPTAKAPCTLRTTVFIHWYVAIYVSVLIVDCCQNHLAANCFSYSLLSVKRLSQARRHDDTLSEPRAKTSVASSSRFLFSLVKNVGRNFM